MVSGRAEAIELTQSVESEIRIWDDGMVQRQLGCLLVSSQPPCKARSTSVRPGLELARVLKRCLPTIVCPLSL
jgi:hypothetical protein